MMDALDGSLDLLLFARDNDWTKVVVAFLVVFSVRTITKKKCLTCFFHINCVHFDLPVRPVLGLPATTESSFLCNVFDIDHINNFLFTQSNFLVDFLARTSSARALSSWTKGKIGDINNTGS